MNNYKVTVREVREWAFLISAENWIVASDKALKMIRKGEPHHVGWFEDPVAYEVKHIPITHEHNQERP